MIAAKHINIEINTLFSDLGDPGLIINADPSGNKTSDTDGMVIIKHQR